MRTFLLFNKTRYGAKKIEYKLTVEKGVDRTLVANMIADELSDEFEIALATEMATKYIKQKKIADKSGYQKVFGFLYQRGFENRIISKVMGTIFDVVFSGDED